VSTVREFDSAERRIPRTQSEAAIASSLRRLDAGGHTILHSSTPFFPQNTAIITKTPKQMFQRSFLDAN